MTEPVWFLAALCCAVAGVLVLLPGRRAAAERAAERRLARLTPPAADGQTGGDGGRARWHGRVAAVLPARVTAGGLAAILAGAAVGVWLVGAPLTLGTAAIAVAGVAAASWRQRSRRRNRIRAQLPGYLARVVRGLEVGRSLPGALQHAAVDLEEPLAGVVRRIERRVALGDDLGAAFEVAARTQGLRELRLVALAVRVNQQYGGELGDILAGVAAMITERERALRELRALTAETRLTAWVLGGMPAMVALYLGVAEPGYFTGMWETAAGRAAIIIAVALQIAGAALLYRLVRRV